MILVEGQDRQRPARRHGRARRASPAAAKTYFMIRIWSCRWPGNMRAGMDDRTGEPPGLAISTQITNQPHQCGSDSIAVMVFDLACTVLDRAVIAEAAGFCSVS